MKALTIFSIALLFMSCSESKSLSPAETSEIAAESFYHGDKITLKKYTTAEGFSNLVSIQDLFLEDKNSTTDFKIIDEALDGDVAWIKYSTAYDTKPSVFKLVNENGRWKVTHNGPRDKGPF